MEVQLYVYDLTQGMARAMSQQLLGIQIDAVYHTSLVFGGIEYFFGAGVQTCLPGSTHHGQPMQIHPMGVTHLPRDTIDDYVESLKSVYTHESYDLFDKNCNNFTNDLSTFLVGKGIPDHITGLPKRVLDTPFGQMLRPMIDSSMRKITQAPVPNYGISNGAPRPSAGSSESQTLDNVDTNGTHPLRSSGSEGALAYGSVMETTSLRHLEEIVTTAGSTALTIFFTSSTCAPCKLAYPTFDTLAEQHPQAAFVKVDINRAREIATRFQIRATPTFITYNKGVKEDQWAGADPVLLRSRVDNLILSVYPPHPHSLLKAPGLQFGSLSTFKYGKVPPLDKITSRLGDSARLASVSALFSFIKNRAADPKTAKLPDLQAVGSEYQTGIMALPLDRRFAAIDLLRCAMIDPRVSGFFAAEKPFKTLPAIIKDVLQNDGCPHNQRLVTLHLASNTFSSPLHVKELMVPGNTIATLFVELVAQSLLDASHPTTQVASARLAFNLAVANYCLRREVHHEGLLEGLQVELTASLSEALSQNKDNADMTESLLLALGYLIFFAPQDGELLDLCRALDVKATLAAASKDNPLAKEVASLL